MLVVQIPDGGERKRREQRRRRRALLYLVPGPLIVAAVLIAPVLWLKAVAVAVELWWLRAAWTDPVIWKKP